MKFGERLKAARIQLSLTQEMVAQELFVSRQTISSWENERSYPDIQSLIKLSNYYQLSLDILLKEDNGMVEEIERKEELAKINKIWGVSYIINLVFVGLILLNQFSNSNHFEMGTGVQIIISVVLFLNVGLLMYVTGERDKLSDKECRNQKYMPKVMFGLFLLSAIALVMGGILIYLGHPSGYTVLGMGVGGLSATVGMHLVMKTLKIQGSK